MVLVSGVVSVSQAIHPWLSLWLVIRRYQMFFHTVVAIQPIDLVLLVDTPTQNIVAVVCVRINLSFWVIVVVHYAVQFAFIVYCQILWSGQFVQFMASTSLPVCHNICDLLRKITVQPVIAAL